MRGWLILWLLMGTAQAHEFRPAVLDLELTTTGATVVWTVETDQMDPRRTRPTLTGCTETNVHLDQGALSRTQIQFTCPQPPQNLTVRHLLPGQQVVVNHADNHRMLDAAHPTLSLRQPVGTLRSFIAVGFTHILSGADHLLFVLGFVLLATTRRKLLWALTGFTLGHSLTLALATLGWIHVPVASLEAVIALSVVFLAAEVLRSDSLARRHPGWVATGFGLLHGLGFASALSELLSGGGILLALVGFNLGVEAGQLVFVGGVLLTLWIFRLDPRQRSRPLSVIVYGMGTVASVMLWTRLTSFWG